jgi:hypothetical protein
VIQCLLPMEAEFSRPAWVFGYSSYEVLNESTLVCSYRYILFSLDESILVNIFAMMFFYANNFTVMVQY